MSLPTAEVRLYVLKEDGSLEEDSLDPLAHYGVCPNVGDTICKSWSGDGKICYSVQRRYFIDNHDGRQGWVVVLREIEISRQIGAVLKTWEEDEAFWAERKAKEAAEERAARDRALDELLHPERLEPIQPPLNHREHQVMMRLAQIGTGRSIATSSIPRFGPQTQRDLIKRNFIDVASGEMGKPGAQVRLTKKGLKDWQALMKHRDRNPYL